MNYDLLGVTLGQRVLGAIGIWLLLGVMFVLF